MIVLSFWNIIFYGILAFAGYLFYKYIKRQRRHEKYQKWNNQSNEIVIVHCLPAGTTLPNPSPFAMKVLTFLRMAQIPYKIDTSEPFGEMGRSPFVTYMGKNICETQLIMEFIKKKFNKNLNGNYTDMELALGDAVRIMLEDHFSWGLVMWRFVFEGFSKINKIMDLDNEWLVKRIIRYKMRKRCEAQGMGLLKKEQIMKLSTKDLKIFSKLLGDKQFILGDEPCEADAAIFGQLSQVVWATPGSPFEELANGECGNIKEYCNRMKMKFWPDWESSFESGEKMKIFSTIVGQILD